MTIPRPTRIRARRNRRRSTPRPTSPAHIARSEEHTSELQSPCNLVCRLLLEKKKKKNFYIITPLQITSKNTTLHLVLRLHPNLCALYLTMSYHCHHDHTPPVRPSAYLDTPYT